MCQLGWVVTVKLYMTEGAGLMNSYRLFSLFFRFVPLAYSETRQAFAVNC